MNAKLDVGMLLHAYQPPMQTETMLEKIYRESYEPLISALENEPNLFFSMDIAKSLGERLSPEFRERIAVLYRAGRIELLNTFAYHFLGPLTPRQFIKRQLRQNEEFYRTNFIGLDPLPGIFPPELAFAPEMMDSFKDLHYSWCLADDEPFVKSRWSLPPQEQAAFDWIPTSRRIGVPLRSGYRSKQIAFGKCGDPRQFADDVINSLHSWGQSLGQNRDEGYLIIALDAETFGHHHRRYIENMLIPFANRIAERSDEAALVPIDTIFRRFTKKPTFIPRGSWSTDDSPFPYPLWSHPHDPFHRAWNEYLELAFAMTPLNLEGEIEHLYDTSFYSCIPWQYSMGNKNIAKWCLFNFSQIADFHSESYEGRRMKELVNEMSRLTS
jgi:predicted glycosyl hydrolase (DUF1957 family)